MKKNEWYTDRILWKAQQHELFNKRCIKFTDAGDEVKSNVLANCSLDGSPVLLFFISSKKWTLLTDFEVVSMFDGGVSSCSLDTINHTVKPSFNKENSISYEKQNCQYIDLPKSGVKIWAPNGKELFALISILKMFPLNVPN